MDNTYEEETAMNTFQNMQNNEFTTNGATVVNLSLIRQAHVADADNMETADIRLERLQQ